MENIAEAKFGIVCMTEEALTSQMVLFEAGAVSKGLRTQHVCPYLLNVDAARLPSVFGHFHYRQATEDDTRALLMDLNAGLGEKALAPDQLERTFARSWPELKGAIEGLREKAPVPNPPPATIDSVVQKLDEMLAILRGLRPEGPTALPSDVRARWAQLGVVQPDDSWLSGLRGSGPGARQPSILSAFRGLPVSIKTAEGAEAVALPPKEQPPKKGSNRK